MSNFVETSPHPFAPIIGLGKMGVMHAAMCQAAPGMEVAALVDMNAGLGSQIQSMGVKAPFFNSLEKTFAEAGPLDAAIIATPQFAPPQRGRGMP